MRQRWRKNKEKELSRQNLEGNTWESTRSKEKASIAAITGKAAVLGRHWRNEQVMMKLVLRVSWEKSCKGARWGVALCWGAGSTARRGRTSPQTTGSGPAHPAQGSASLNCHPRDPSPIVGPQQLLMKTNRAAAYTPGPGSRSIREETSSLAREWASLPNITGCSHTCWAEHGWNASVCIKLSSSAVLGGKK